jgi:tripartite-type tricarboxylate transporter receptor subunit TctC
MIRFVLIVGMVLLFAAVSPVTGNAQTFPDHPIQLVIPSTPGSGVDIVGRFVAEELGKVLNTQVIPMNKPGASFTAGTDAVVRSKKDGYTLLYVPSTAMVYSRIPSPEVVPYDPVKDLDPLGLHVWNPMFLVVKAGSPWKTFSQFVDEAKKKPGELRMSLLGALAIERFNLEIIKSLTGAQVSIIPFKGPAEAMAALLGGHVESSFIGVGLGMPQVQSGELRPLLITKKWSDLPDVPTTVTLGYKKDLDSGWFALYGPAGLPEEVKKVLVPAFEKVAKNPELKVRIDKMGFAVDYKPPAELTKIMIESFESGMDMARKISAQEKK